MRQFHGFHRICPVSWGSHNNAFKKENDAIMPMTTSSLVVEDQAKLLLENLHTKKQSTDPWKLYQHAHRAPNRPKRDGSNRRQASRQRPPEMKDILHLELCPAEVGSVRALAASCRRSNGRSPSPSQAPAAAAAAVVTKQMNRRAAGHRGKLENWKPKDSNL